MAENNETKMLTVSNSSAPFPRTDAFFDLIEHILERAVQLLGKTEVFLIKLAIVILAVLKLLDLLGK